MGIYTTKPIRELNKTEFKCLLSNNRIIISDHALDHLSAKQRKIFKQEEISDMIEKENPRKVYLQQNERYAAYYRRADGYRKIIIEMRNQTNIVVSFMDLFEIPKLRI